MNKDISDKINAMVELLETMDDCREALNGIAKDLKEKYNLNATYVKTVATAIKNGKLEDLETKNNQIQNIIEMVHP